MSMWSLCTGAIEVTQSLRPQDLTKSFKQDAFNKSLKSITADSNETSLGAV